MFMRVIIKHAGRKIFSEIKIRLPAGRQVAIFALVKWTNLKLIIY